MSAGQGLPGILAAGLSARQSRALFSWHAGDLSLTPLSGQAPTFVRATAGGAVRDAAGQWRTPGHSAERWESVTLDGVETAGLLLEPQRTNEFLRSDELDHASWTKTQVSIVANAAAGPTKALTLDKVVESAAASVSHRVGQVMTIVAGNPVALSGVVAPGERTRAQLRATAGGNIIQASIDTATGVVTTGQTGTGAVIGSGRIALADGRWWWWVSGTLDGASTAITCEVFLLDAAGATVYTGDGTSGLYLGHLQMEEARVPTSAIATTSAAVTRNQDNLSYPILFGPQALTLYARFVERGSSLDALGGAVSARVLQLGSGTGRASLLATSGGAYYMRQDTGASNRVSAGPTANWGDLVELCGQLYADGAVQIHTRLNGAAVVAGTKSTALALASTWATNTLYVNAEGTGGVGTGLYLDLVVAAGIRTLDQMAQLL